MFVSQNIVVLLLINIASNCIVELTAQGLVFEDDRQSWNAFFRRVWQHDIPKFPIPGTFNQKDFDDLRYGFPKAIWGTTNFQSLLEMPDVDDMRWGLLWDFVTLVLENDYGKEKLSEQSPQNLWESYMQFMMEIFCCKNEHLNLGIVHFGCADTVDRIDCCITGKELTADGYKVCNTKGQQVVMDFNKRSISTMKGKFYVWMCVIFINMEKVKHKVSESFLRMCPDPCAKFPCGDIVGAIKDSCKTIDSPLRVYEDAYTCECQHGFYFDPDMKVCHAKSPCSQNPCDAKGTKECLNIEDSFHCICKKEYTGLTCSELVNACIERINEIHHPGNLFCMVHEGNECSPVLGSDTYFCGCHYPHTRLTNVKEIADVFSVSASSVPDNCGGREDICAFVICNSTGHGRCMPSGDRTRAICICDKDSEGNELWEGDYCETRVSQWKAWLEWEACEPECGESCAQRRRRECEHEVGQRYCRGSDEAIRPCKPSCRPCPQLVLPELSGVFMGTTDSSYYRAVLYLVAILIIVLQVLRLLVEKIMLPSEGN